MSAGSRSRRVDSTWPNLMKIGPEPLQRLAQARAARLVVAAADRDDARASARSHGWRTRPSAISSTPKRSSVNVMKRRRRSVSSDGCRARGVRRKPARQARRMVSDFLRAWSMSNICPIAFLATSAACANCALARLTPSAMVGPKKRSASAAGSQRTFCAIQLTSAASAPSPSMDIGGSAALEHVAGHLGGVGRVDAHVEVGRDRRPRRPSPRPRTARPA